MDKDKDFVQHIDNQFIFEAGSINTIIKDSTFNAPVYTCRQEEEGKEKGEVITMQTLLQRIIPMVCSTRMWFAVYKGFLESKKTRSKDYAGFKKMIEDNYDKDLPYSISTSELSDLDCFSFSKPIDEWDIAYAPIKRAKEFYAYKNLAKTVRDLALNMA